MGPLQSRTARVACAMMCHARSDVSLMSLIVAALSSIALSRSSRCPSCA